MLAILPLDRCSVGNSRQYRLIFLSKFDDIIREQRFGYKDLPFTSPIAETSTDIITMGFGETLDEAFEFALKQMIGFLERFFELSAEDTYVLCSLAGNFHIIQVVNIPQKSVHGMLSKSILPNAILL